MGMSFSVHEMSLAVRIIRRKSEATTILTPGDGVKNEAGMVAQRFAVHTQGGGSIVRAKFSHSCRIDSLFSAMKADRRICTRYFSKNGKINSQKISNIAKVSGY